MTGAGCFGEDQKKWGEGEVKGDLIWSWSNSLLGVPAYDGGGVLQSLS